MTAPNPPDAGTAPTPAPSTLDPTNFDARCDEYHQFFPNWLNVKFPAVLAWIKDRATDVEGWANSVASAVTAAATSATNAATSATSAGTSATSAGNSAAAAQASLNTFRGQYYGPFASDPTTDPLGNPPSEGDLYWNTATKTMRAYNGTAWAQSYLPASAYMDLVSAQTVAGVKTFSSNPVMSAGTANAIAYLNASKVLTSGPELTFDGTSLRVGGQLVGPTSVNNIGVPGQQGFGVGVAPSLPSGFAPLSGTTDPASANYGNYQFSDGSIMVYVPAFVYKYGTGSNGLAVNVVDVKSLTAYESLAAANAAGYALHRAFYNTGGVRPGFFVDKYQCSNNGGIASSLRNGNPLSSAADHNPFSGLNGAPSNIYGSAINAAKTRGASFFCNTRFIHAALALLANAHASASTSTTFCAWYMPSANFPKGCNSNALGDVNDGTLSFTSDGYLNCAKTGSANLPAKTAHNGQLSGVMDLNGNMWEINLGMTSNGSNFYLLKTSVDVTTITSGTTLATDAWGATGIAAMYDNIGATYESLTASSSVKTFGSANQVLSQATSGTAWAAAGAGIPLVGGTGGSNQFGNDGLWDYRPDQLCAISGGDWGYGSAAGVWALILSSVRGSSHSSVGFRAASYL